MSFDALDNVDQSSISASEDRKIPSDVSVIPSVSRETSLKDRILGILNRNKNDHRKTLEELTTSNLEDHPEDVSESDQLLENNGITMHVGEQGKEVNLEDSLSISDQELTHPDLSEGDLQIDTPSKIEEIGSELSRAEEMELRFRQNEVKWKIDELAKRLVWQNDSRNTYKDFTGEQIKEGLDWIAEDQIRISEATEYFISLEDILNKANSLPMLTGEEQKSIGLKNDLLEKIKTGLRERGIQLGPNSRDESPNTSLVEGNNLPISVDPETAFQYLYHATPLINISNIAENGLLPSGRWSKEPGTIFYNGYDGARQYLTPMGFLIRTHGTNVPEIQEDKKDYMDDKTGKLVIRGGPSSSRSPINLHNLEFSFDGGQTWRKDMSMFIDKNS